MELNAQMAARRCVLGRASNLVLRRSMGASGVDGSTVGEAGDCGGLAILDPMDNLLSKGDDLSEVEASFIEQDEDFRKVALVIESEVF